MSELISHANHLGADLVAPLTTDATGTTIDRPGQVVAATPAAVAAGAGVTAAAAAGAAGYVAEEAADN